MDDPRSTIVCAACGEGFPMQEILDGHEDMPVQIDPLTGIKRFYHSDCLDLKDVQAVAFRMVFEDGQMAGLAICFTRQPTARRYFKRMREWVEKGHDPTVGFNSDGLGTYHLVIKTGKEIDEDPRGPVSLEFNGMASEGVESLITAFREAGGFRIIAGKLTNSQFEPFDGTAYDLPCFRMTVNGQTYDGRKTPS